MKILVVCRCEIKHGYKIGNVEFKTPEYPLSIEGIREIERQIKERLQADSAVVLNVIPLSEDDKTETTDSRRLREREEFFGER